jgi:hypothetical protein
VSLLDLELGFPGAFLLMTLGALARPLLAPFALRTTPLPVPARALLLAGLAGSAALLWRTRRR